MLGLVGMRDQCSGHGISHKGVLELKGNCHPVGVICSLQLMSGVLLDFLPSTT